MVCDGKYREEFAILSDRICANIANIECPLDGTAWHTYRVTTQGSQFRVYVDESPTPALSGTLTLSDTSTRRARIIFGSGSSPSRQDIYIDYVYCYSGGVNGPAARTNDQTPDISVTVADSVGKGSLSEDSSHPTAARSPHRAFRSTRTPRHSTRSSSRSGTATATRATARSTTSGSTRTPVPGSSTSPARTLPARISKTRC